jgi:hypothetical protein
MSNREMPASFEGFVGAHRKIPSAQAPFSDSIVCEEARRHERAA